MTRGHAILRPLSHEAAPTRVFYTDVMTHLQRADVPFLVGGTFALTHYTGIERKTKDLDLFVHPGDVERAVDSFLLAEFDAEVTFPHWLAKVWRGSHFVDLIFSSGNAVATVDDGWFAHANDADVLDMRVSLCAPEEMIWSKAFVQERERYDGADVIHLMHHCGASLDWRRLVDRFGGQWRVLFSFIVLYGFAYPGERDAIPQWVSDELAARFVAEGSDAGAPVCNGTLLSREQYLPDVSEGYVDPRLAPLGNMTPEELRRWTAAIGEEH